MSDLARLGVKLRQVKVNLAILRATSRKARIRATGRLDPYSPVADSWGVENGTLLHYSKTPRYH